MFMDIEQKSESPSFLLSWNVWVPCLFWVGVWFVFTACFGLVFFLCVYLFTVFVFAGVFVNVGIFFVSYYCRCFLFCLVWVLFLCILFVHYICICWCFVNVGVVFVSDYCMCLLSCLSLAALCFSFCVYLCYCFFSCIKQFWCSFLFNPIWVLESEPSHPPLVWLILTSQKRYQWV